MFAGNCTTGADDIPKEVIQRLLHLLGDFWIGRVCNHDVDVDIAVSGMSETRDRKSILLLERAGELHQFDQLSPGHRDIFVQLHQPGRLQRFGKPAAQIPEFFAILFAKCGLERKSSEGTQYAGKRCHRRTDRFLVPIQIQQEMRVPFGHSSMHEMFARSLEREPVGNFQRRRKITLQ